MTKFYDSGQRPPRGGWRATLDGVPFGNGLSESDAFQERKKFLKNNGRFVSDIDIERELWNFWCSREPERCSGPGLMPSLGQQAVNLGSAIVRTTKAALRGEPITSTEALRDARQAICNACQFFSKGRCLKCGCNIGVKTALAQEKCPIAKWLVIGSLFLNLLNISMA